MADVTIVGVGEGGPQTDQHQRDSHFATHMAAYSSCTLALTQMAWGISTLTVLFELKGMTFGFFVHPEGQCHVMGRGSHTSNLVQVQMQNAPYTMSIFRG